MVTCNCGASLMAPKKAVGKKVKCPRCDKVFTVPDPGSTVDRMIYALSDDQYNKPPLEEQPEPPAPKETEKGKLCPNCNSEMPKEAALCIRCGFHLDRGAAIAAASGGGRKARARATRGSGAGFASILTSEPSRTIEPPSIAISVGACIFVIGVTTFFITGSGAETAAAMACAGVPMTIAILIGGAIRAVILQIGFKIAMKDSLEFGHAFRVALATLATEMLFGALISLAMGVDEANKFFSDALGSVLNVVVVIFAYRMFLGLPVIKAFLIWLVQLAFAIGVVALLTFGLDSVVPVPEAGQ